MALPVYTTQDATTYKTNIDATASDHDSRITTLEGAFTFEQGSAPSISGASTVDIDITVPSWVKHITLMFNSISVASTTSPEIQLGTSAAWKTTGYISYVQTVATTCSMASVTSGVPIGTSLAAAENVTGHMVLTKLSSTSNVWIASSSITNENANETFIASSRFDLAATLTRIRANNTANFDGVGQISWVYYG